MKHQLRCTSARVLTVVLFFFFGANSFWLIEVNLDTRGVHFRWTDRVFWGLSDWSALLQLVHLWLWWSAWESHRLQDCVDILLICSPRQRYGTKIWARQKELSCGAINLLSTSCLLRSRFASILSPVFVTHPMPERTVWESSKKRGGGDDQINIALRKWASTLYLLLLFCLCLSVL